MQQDFGRDPRQRAANFELAARQRWHRCVRNIFADDVFVRDAKVTQLGDVASRRNIIAGATTREHDVVRLQVAMHDAAGVQVL